MLPYKAVTNVITNIMRAIDYVCEKRFKCNVRCIAMRELWYIACKWCNKYAYDVIRINTHLYFIID